MESKWRFLLPEELDGLSTISYHDQKEAVLNVSWNTLNEMLLNITCRLLPPTEAPPGALGGGGGGSRRGGVGAVVAADSLLSQLALQALDHTVLLLQLLGQPGRGAKT